MFKLKLPIPEVLPTSPLTIFCPFCGAKPGKDCETSTGSFAAIHVARIKAALVIDKSHGLKRAKRRK